MKKIIIPLSLIIIIIFFIGLFFSKKETSLKVLNQNQKNQEQTTKPTTTPTIEINDQSALTFTLEFERKINEELEKLTKDIKPDENKSLSQYREEVLKIQQKFHLATNTQEIDPEILINIAQSLAKISPPPILYSLHLELIKTYYKLGVTLKEYQSTTELQKKILLYNIIKVTLEKIKF